VLAKIFEGKIRILQNLEQQSLRKITGVNGNYESLARGMFQDQMRTGLAGFAIPLTEKKTDEFARGNHSIQGEGDGLGVNGAGCRDGFALFSAVFDVKTHRFQNTLLGLLDGLSETINTRKIVAVGVVAFAIALDGNGIAVESHSGVKFTMMPLEAADGMVAG
jgi:hypothetical protein